MGSFDHPAAEPKPWRKTPLVESNILSRQAGCRIFLKLEHIQPGGSFKSRAIGNLVLSHIKDPENRGKRLHFFIPSGGNAGLAATVAANSYGFPCTVALPTTIKPLMLNRLIAAGANVVSHGETIDEAAHYMRSVLMKEMAMNHGDAIVPIELHPFDREAIWEGVSSLVDELAYQLPQPFEEDTGDYSDSAIPCDAIVCSVGGGGLMNGIIQGLERQSRARGSRKDVHILAAETSGSDSLFQSYAKRSLVTLPKITSIASSLGVVRVANKTLENTLSPPRGVKVHPVVLHDSEAAMGSLRLVDAERILVETACGVAVEAAIGPLSKRAIHNERQGTPDSMSDDGSVNVPQTNPTWSNRLAQIIPDFNPNSRVVIVVCGGSNVSIDMAAEWRTKLDEGWAPRFEVPV
ncbi:hypothetical protein KEM56_007722 [Ascosphaera pollenicola]|nr:hypothetical protein KEM56_007722 [Ascosphaera pollenicola]